MTSPHEFVDHASKNYGSDKEVAHSQYCMQKGDTASNTRVQQFLVMKRVCTIIDYRQSDKTDVGKYLYRYEILVNIADNMGCRFHKNVDLEDAFKFSKVDKVGVMIVGVVA